MMNIYSLVMSLKNSLYSKNTDGINDEYFKEFKANVESIDDYNACILGELHFIVEKD